MPTTAPRDDRPDDGTTHDDGASGTRDDRGSDAHRRRTSRPLSVWLYLLGAVGLGATALFGGGMLVLDPSGASMEMPVEWLAGTPFPDYLVPGLVLFTVLGFGSFLVCYGVVRRRAWAWPAAVGLGVALVGWIAVQMALLWMVNVLHVVYGGLGVALVVLATSPAARRYLR